MDSPLCLLHAEHIAPVKQTEQKKKLKTTETSADIGDRNNKKTRIHLAAQNGRLKLPEQKLQPVIKRNRALYHLTHLER